MKTFTHKDRSEVDLRVAQELKNNQDYIYKTFQEIQALKDGLQTLSYKLELSMAKSWSDVKTVHIEFENLRDEIVSKTNEFNQRVGKVESKVLHLMEAFTLLNEEVKNKYLSIEDFKKTVDQQDESIDSLADALIEKTDYFNIALSTLKAYFQAQLEAAKEELTPVIPKIDPVQLKIDESLKVFKVDFDGLIREIDFLKRENSYDQKKFENIYTLIERSKAR